MTKIRKNLIALFVVVSCLLQLPLSATALPYGFDVVDLYTVPSSVVSVATRDDYKWSCDNDGTLSSGNSNIKSTVSVLKVTVRGSGSLVFTYKVASGTTNNSFVISTDPDIITKTTDFYTYISNHTDKNERIKGEIDWTWKTVPIVAEETELTDIYLIYKTGGSTCKSDDCVRIKNLQFSTGKVSISAVPNQDAFGTVGGCGDYQLGETVTLTATHASGYAFYGWTSGDKLLSRNFIYSFEAATDITVNALFGDPVKIVAENTRTGEIYESIATSLEEADAGDTIWLLGNPVLGENITIPESVTLYIPFSDDFKTVGCRDGTTENSPSFAKADKAFRTLTVLKDSTIDVQGTLLLGGVIGFPSQQYQGHTSGAYGSVLNNGNIIIRDGAQLDCYGFISGAGSISAESGATVYEPFVIYDFSGGSNTLALEQAGQSPFTQYTMQNIRCPLNIHAGAVLYGRCNLYASGEYNKTNAPIIGNRGSGGIIQLQDDAVLKRTVDSSKACSDYCPDIGRVTFDITGGACFDALTMTVLGVTVSTKDVLFPLTYNSVYILNKGSFSIDTGTILMPGAEMTVAEDAVLNVNSRFFVLDGLWQDDLSGKSYPSTEILEKNGFPGSGNLIVNGTMKIGSGIAFGGIIQSRQIGASVITEVLTDTTDGKNPFSSTIVLGGKAAYGDNTTEIQIQARVFDGKDFLPLTSGKEYSFFRDSKWILNQYTIYRYMEDGVQHETADFSVNSEMVGFAREKSVGSCGDINSDGYVNSIDATILAQHLAGIITMNETQMFLADVNQDGFVNSIDATMIAQYLSGIIPEL